MYRNGVKVGAGKRGSGSVPCDGPVTLGGWHKNRETLRAGTRSGQRQA